MICEYREVRSQECLVFKVWGVALSSCGDSSDVTLGVCMCCGEVPDSLGTGPWCSSIHAIQVR